MSSLRGVASVGKRCAQRLDDLCRVVHRQRRLRDEARACAGSRTSSFATSADVLDQMDAAAVRRVELAHRALDLRMPGVADQHHVAAFARVARDFHVHLGDQRTGGVEHREPAARGLVLHRARARRAR